MSKPRPENAQNPLLQLRKMIGTAQWSSQPITQLELAQMLEVSLSFIKAIECGERGLSGSIQRKIRILIGTRWYARGRSWLSLHDRVATTPEDIWAYLEVMRRSLADFGDRDRLKHEIDHLFDQLPPEKQRRLFRSIQDALEEIKKEFYIWAYVKSIKDKQSELLT